MRKLVFMLFCAVSMLSMYAGDVASFVNLGFSADGTRFVFGQFGTTDSDFRAYADIYCIDVIKNSYIPNGTFSILPSEATAEKEGRGVFASLQNGAASFMKTVGVDSSIQGRALYIQMENEPALKSISFRDFETGKKYTVTVHSLSEGSGKSVRSSFYLTVVITDANGKTVTKTAGLPGFMRNGVKNYLIRRILTDNTGRALVFVIEKELYEAKGSSVHYMVETLSF